MKKILITLSVLILALLAFKMVFYQIKRVGDAAVDEVLEAGAVVKEKVVDVGEAAARRIREANPDLGKLKQEAGETLRAGRDLLMKKLRDNE